MEPRICCNRAREVERKNKRWVFISTAAHRGTRRRNINLDELMSRLLIGHSYWARNDDGSRTEVGAVGVGVRGGGRPIFSRLTGALATTGYGLEHGAVGCREAAQGPGAGRLDG